MYFGLNEFTHVPWDMSFKYIFVISIKSIMAINAFRCVPDDFIDKLSILLYIILIFNLKFIMFMGLENVAEMSYEKMSAMIHITDD